LIGNSSGSAGFGQTGDQLNVNPLLGPLTDHGGPTFTHALLTGSPAIDKGKSFGLGTDQRGRQRPYDFTAISNAAGGDSSDIGAYEVNPPQLTITLSGTTRIITCDAEPGRTYQLQYKRDWSAPNWSVLATVIATGPTVTFTDPSVFDPWRVYRVVLLP
jgi:hypothetical protein